MNKTNFKQTEIGEIPEDWEVASLSSKANVKMGQSPSSEFYNNEGNGIEFLQGITTFGEKFPSFNTWCSSPIKIANKDSVLLSVRAPVGEVNLAPKDLCIGRGLASIDGENNLYLYYLLKNHSSFIRNQSTGTVYDSINKSQIESIVLPFPKIEEQQQIASILSSLDDKIELNRKMNKALEEIGKALFKRWFVDFEFPNNDGKPYKSSGGKMVDSELGEIPEGWEVKPLDAIATFLNGVACQKYPPKNEDGLPVIKIGELHNGITENSDRASSSIASEYIIEDGDVLFSWSGCLEIVLWAGGRGVLNQHLFKVSSESYPKWFYYQWTLRYLPFFREVASNKVTTMGHIQRGHITESLVLVPQKTTLEKMDLAMTPLLGKIIANSIEIKSLAKIRDSLLPRLMSGKLRVRN